MIDFTDAMNNLSDAMMAAEPNSPEWIKAKAALRALDEAQLAESEAAFVLASRSIADAVARLTAIIAGVTPDPASAFLGHINAALNDLTPIAQSVNALLSGEPASPLPGSPLTNKASFPSPDLPIMPPVKQKAGAAVPALVGELPDDSNVEQMIDDILRREGGFVNHLSDRGGPTNFGITMRTLASWRSPAPVDLSHVRNLKIDEAREIYRSNYFSGPKLDKLPTAIQPLMFDMSINHGPASAIKLLQQVLNDSGQPCDIDGGIGDETLRCAKGASTAMGKALINALVARRVHLYRQIVAGDESQRVFLAGWLNRANEFAAA